DEYTSGDLSEFEFADGGGERCDRGGAGGVFRALSTGAGADMVLRVCVLYSCVDHAGILVCAAVLVGGSDAVCGATGSRRRRSSVLGAPWWFCGRGGSWWVFFWA